MNYFNTEYFDQKMSTSDSLFLYKTDKLFNNIRFLEDEYPDFKKWFYKKVMLEIRTGHRVIISKNNILGEIIGLTILKKTPFENKICTLWVNDILQNQGIGSELVERSIDFLETKKPLITVSEPRISQFAPILRKYEFEFYERHDSYYKHAISELVFNGKLNDFKAPNTKNPPNQIKLMNELTSH